MMLAPILFATDQVRWAVSGVKPALYCSARIASGLAIKIAEVRAPSP